MTDRTPFSAGATAAAAGRRPSSLRVVEPRPGGSAATAAEASPTRGRYPTTPRLEAAIARRRGTIPGALSRKEMAAWVARSRAEQGLQPGITDPAGRARLAGLLARSLKRRID